jgi:hypothetical protein
VRQHGITRCNDNEVRSSSGGRTTSFGSSASDGACLSDWDKPLSVSDLLTLLFDLKRMLAVAGNPTMVVIIVIREAVPVAASVTTCIRSTLPAILACCECLAVVLEDTSARHNLLGASFQSAGAGKVHHAVPQLFDTLSAAFAHTQRLAPLAVLELQRHALRLSFPTNGQWS